MRGRRRKQSSRGNHNQCSGKEDSGDETLAHMSKQAVDKLLRLANVHASPGTSKAHRCDDIVAASESEPKRNGKQVVDTRVTWNDLDSRGIACDPVMKERKEVNGGSFSNIPGDGNEETDDIDWEDGSTHVWDPVQNHRGDDIRTMTIEFHESPDLSKRKPIHRATAEEKELAELVHKVHLLCLLARGRIIDRACDDPLIQASLLSILPIHLLKISEAKELCAKALSPIVHWFHDNFRVISSVSKKRTFRSALAFALETREGSLEEIAALSVALFRALKLTVRFVSILDVASIKPVLERCETTNQDARKLGMGIFNNSTLMVDRKRDLFASPFESSSLGEKNKVHEPCCKASSKRNTQSKDFPPAVGSKDCAMDCEAQDTTSEACTSQGLKRRGDFEFEMQLQMALSATAIATPQNNTSLDVDSNVGDGGSPFKRVRKASSEESPSHGISAALGSKKIGSPLYWAEVYCGGENLDGKWVHVDAVHAIIDGEQKVETAAAACKTTLRYVVAFAGHGAKDVTRRYCMKWYKIAPQRVNSVWWDAVLTPLRQLESVGTEGVVLLEKRLVDASKKYENVEVLRVSDYQTFNNTPNQVDLPGNPISLGLPKVSGRQIDVESSGKNPQSVSRNSIEDMELETKSLTEPLPTNQQAYKNHPLYALERWLTKFQTLHPSGPVLGFCSGHAVYPRSCVQTLKTKERWLREGLQVKAKELPAKVVEQSGKLKNVQSLEDGNCGDYDGKGTIELYGKWQLEPLLLPHAVNGIVPKNERGQVEVWSKNCLPPGTTHLRLPRVFYVAKRLGIDYAPAMVGFEFRNGRSVPVFDGIVVCIEFKDAILEAYAEEEERRVAEEKKRNEAHALSRWYQLISSIIIRQRLNNCYGNDFSSKIESNIQNQSMVADVHGCSPHKQSSGCQKEDARDIKTEVLSVAQTDDHEHAFLIEDQSSLEESSVRTMRCRCGFSVQVEEL